jgi:acyl-CoA thioester hydrolase
VKRAHDDQALPPEWFETPVRVRYAETDQMGVVYHGNFFVWFEVGRTDLCRQCGFSYHDMERDHDAYLIVVEAECRYRKPARYEDDLVVRTCVADLSRRTMRFRYEVVRSATGELLAEGSTTHVVANRAGKPRTFPPEHAALLRSRLPGRAPADTVPGEGG